MAQRLLSTHAAFYGHFNIQRRLISRTSMKQFGTQSLAVCTEAIAYGEPVVDLCASSSQRDIAINHTQRTPWQMASGSPTPPAPRRAAMTRQTLPPAILRIFVSSKHCTAA